MPRSLSTREQLVLSEGRYGTALVKVQDRHRTYLQEQYDCVETSAGSIPGFVRYRSIPEFCSILDTRYLRCKSNIHIEHSSQ